jgi:hypothetical protein
MARRRSKGEGEVFAEGSGWAVRWREKGRRRYRGGFSSEALAKRVLARIRGELAVQRSGLPADPRTTSTLGDYAEDFLKNGEKGTLWTTTQADGKGATANDDELKALVAAARAAADRSRPANGKTGPGDI